MSTNDPLQVMSSRDFNQDTARAKKAAARAPVFITDRGTTTHVLMSLERYKQLTGGGRTIVEMLAMPGAADIDFEPKRADGLFRPADLS